MSKISLTMDSKALIDFMKQLAVLGSDINRLHRVLELLRVCELSDEYLSKNDSLKIELDIIHKITGIKAERIDESSEEN